jgi:hypothetical protein
MKLAVLTSGGDSAGMNAVVRAVVKAGILKYVAPPLFFPMGRRCEQNHTEDVRRGSSEKGTKALSAETQTRLPMRPTSRRRSTSRYAILRSSVICASATALSYAMGRVTAPVGGPSRVATSCALDGTMCAVGLRRYAHLAPAPSQSALLKSASWWGRARIGWHSHRHRALASVPNPRRPSYGRI